MSPTLEVYFGSIVATCQKSKVEGLATVIPFEVNDKSEALSQEMHLVLQDTVLSTAGNKCYSRVPRGCPVGLTNKHVLVS